MEIANLFNANGVLQRPSFDITPWNAYIIIGTKRRIPDSAHPPRIRCAQRYTQPIPTPLLLQNPHLESLPECNIS